MDVWLLNVLFVTGLLIERCVAMILTTDEGEGFTEDRSLSKRRSFLANSDTDTSTASNLAKSSDHSGIMDTGTTIALYCLVVILLVILLVIGGIWLRKKIKKDKLKRMTRNMRTNFVMYSEDDRRAHTYTRPVSEYSDCMDNEYTEIEEEHTIRFKFVKAKRFRTLASKLAADDIPTTQTSRSHSEATVNFRSKNSKSVPREDSSGYIVPGEELTDDVFIDIHKDKNGRHQPHEKSRSLKFSETRMKFESLTKS